MVQDVSTKIGSLEDVSGRYMPAGNTFAMQRTVIFFFYDRKTWNMQYFKEIKYVGIFD